MQRAVNTLTDTIFPGVHIFEENDSERGQFRQRQCNPFGQKPSSNLPLQISLYFNVFYFPFWLIISVIALFLKVAALTRLPWKRPDLQYEFLHPLYRVVVIAVLVVTSAVEAARLYLGYSGNLSEMIPELAGFWLLTLLLQLPLQAFLLLNEYALILPMERAANVIMITFVACELAFGYSAIKSVSKQLTARFHLETFQMDPPAASATT